MKSIIKKSTWYEIYKMLDKVSPLAYNCGSLCGSICCTPETSTKFDEISDEKLDMGIYLLPGEEKIHSKQDSWIKWSSDYAENYDFPDSWHGKVYFIKCKTPPHCPREKRPLQCRTYPLYPYLDDNNNLCLILNPFYTAYECPLIYNNIPLNSSFYRNTLEVWKILIQDPLIFDLIKSDSKLLDESEIIIPTLQ